MIEFETLKLREDAGAIFVEIDAPPMNLPGPAPIRDLVSLIQWAEADERGVVVFKSADPDYFISHVEVTRIAEYRGEAAKLTGEPPLAGSVSATWSASPRSRVVRAARVASSCWRANVGAVYDNYIDRVAAQCVNTMRPKSSTKLAAFDVWIWNQCYAM